MYTDTELAETIAALKSASPGERAAMLKALWAWPARDERLWKHLEALLEDSAPCTFGSPLKIGEIRWLAAHSLAAEFKSQRIKQKIQLVDAVEPLTFPELQQIAQEAGHQIEPDRQQMLSTFTVLRIAGRLPLRTLNL